MPSAAEVDQAIALLRQSSNYEYFFHKLSSADWIEPLADRRFFTEPPEPRSEGSHIQFPFWPESRYLARMAPQAPDLVVRVLVRIPPTQNPRVHEDIVDAACALPAHLAATLTRLIEPFADDTYHFLLPEKLAVLIRHLADGGELADAVRLARALLRPQPAALDDIESHGVRSNPRPRISEYEYAEVSDSVFAAIRRVNPAKAYDLAVDLLEDSLSGGDPDVDRSADFSYLWRPTIEDGSPQGGYGDMRDALVTAVRDAACDDRVDIQLVVSDLESRQWSIFVRVALYALGRRAPLAPDLAIDRARRAELLNDPILHHEYRQVLREAMSLADDDEQQELLDLAIAAGQGSDDSSDDNKLRRDYRTAGTLTALGAALPVRGREVLRELMLDLSEHGVTQQEIERSVGPFGIVTSFVSPTSPLSATEITQMADAQLLGYLASWVPPAGWDTPTPEGLGRVLHDAVAQDPARFAGFANEFRHLAPTYVRSLTRGLREGLKGGTGFDWLPVLQLGTWVMAQSDQPSDHAERGRDPDWSWTRAAIVDLLEGGLADGHAALPFKLRDVVWALLAQLLQDPDPTPEYEGEYGGANMDPFTLAINSVRGSALHATVQYAHWVRRNVGDTATFADMPEVSAALDEHLDTASDPSIGIRSVYGRVFPQLHLLNPDWAESRVSTIFPLDQESAAWFKASSEAFIVFTQPFDDLADVLGTVYAAAAQRLRSDDEHSHRYLDPGGRLAGHLAAFLARGVWSVTDAAVGTFFASAPAEFRGAVHRHLSEVVGWEEPPAEMVERGMAVWEMRLEAVRGDPAGNMAELESFSAWFERSALDPAWRLRHLMDVLKLTGGRIDHTWDVFRTLEDLAKQAPSDALEAVRWLSQPTDEPWQFRAGQDHIMRILAIGLAADATRDQATSLVHHLGARGHIEFRALLAQP